MVVGVLVDVLLYITMIQTILLLYQYCGGLLHTVVEVLVDALPFVTMTRTTTLLYQY